MSLCAACKVDVSVQACHHFEEGDLIVLCDFSALPNWPVFHERFPSLKRFCVGRRDDDTRLCLGLDTDDEETAHRLFEQAHVEVEG